VETAERLSAPAVAQPLFEMADRNLVGDFGCGNYTQGFYLVFVAAPGGSGSVFAMGRGEFK
jgi:hypothetical protein